MATAVSLSDTKLLMFYVQLSSLQGSENLTLILWLSIILMTVLKRYLIIQTTI